MRAGGPEGPPYKSLKHRHSSPATRRSEQPPDANVVAPVAAEAETASEEDGADEGVENRADAAVAAKLRVIDVVEHRSVLEPSAQENRPTQEVRQAADAAKIAGGKNREVIA